MATMHYIVSGPSRWDLMLSLFEGKAVSFTLSDEPRKKFSLNDAGVVKVVVTTLHEHAYEDYILMDPIPEEARKASFNPKRDEPAWLIIAEHESVDTPDAPFDTVLIEYNERTRLGAAVTYSEEEIYSSNGVYIASYWKEKMEVATATS